MPKLSELELEFREQNILRYLGEGSRHPSSLLEEMVGPLVEVARELIQTAAIWEIYAGDELEEQEVSSLPEPIQGAEFFAFALCTVGDLIEGGIRALNARGKPVEALILDAVGSAAVSELAEAVACEIAQWARGMGYGVSRAFEPGAGATRWPLGNQKLVFEHLPAQEIGVTLTEDLLMRPRKSLSFLMGIGKHVVSTSHPFSCTGCPRIDCRFRHVPAAEARETEGRAG
jgi:hypothetical protein